MILNFSQGRLTEMNAVILSFYKNSWNIIEDALKFCSFAAVLYAEFGLSELHRY